MGMENSATTGHLPGRKRHPVSSGYANDGRAGREIVLRGASDDGAATAGGARVRKLAGSRVRGRRSGILTTGRQTSRGGRGERPQLRERPVGSATPHARTRSSTLASRCKQRGGLSPGTPGRICGHCGIAPPGNAVCDCQSVSLRS